MATHVIGTHGIRRGDGRRHAASPLRWLEEVVGKLLASLSWYRRYRTTVRELEALSNRELDDIGIARCDIPMIAMQSANATEEVR